MSTHRKECCKNEMNRLGRLGIPFFFAIDFEEKTPRAIPLDELGDGWCIQIGNTTAGTPLFNSDLPELTSFNKYPVDRKTFDEGFQQVMKHLLKGNTFLINLTYPTLLDTHLNLDQIYILSQSKYKVYCRNQWLSFSPEAFIKIENGKISACPMKGTIDASVPGAEAIILNDMKEKAEHHTIIDLIRNDLSRVARNVHVSRYRFIDTIHTHDKKLLQVSSEISGQLPGNYENHLGEIIFDLLPAGSISGAPKRKTVEIINQVEKQERGFYTGIAGVFDGKILESTVLIRFIEKKGGHLIYRSGCGITHMSCSANEYKELIDKVYVPVYREHKDSQWKGDEYNPSQQTVQLYPDSLV
ncbi:MAG TPA: aminodeoxychorismate synthase component I [Saprospiraceae bacterium]|nr:aminodeoxychorismate synthase component I [Saprospiraceae bacterium]